MELANHKTTMVHDDEHDDFITVQRRRRRPPYDPHYPCHFYRPSNVPRDLHGLLERSDLTEEHILTFIKSGVLPEGSWWSSSLNEPESQRKAFDEQVQAYRSRRLEIQELRQKLRSGGAARVDDDGRLVPVTEQVTPQPQLQQVRQAVEAHNRPADPPPPPPAPPFLHPFHHLMDNPEDVDRRAVEADERLAAEAIARAVERYVRRGDVNLDDLQLVPVAVPPHPAIRNLTFRRICFAVFSVVAAFTCIMIQTMPLWERRSNLDDLNTSIDPLLNRILHIRTIEDHQKQCNGLDRGNHLTWSGRLLQLIGLSTRFVDCSDGVLYIPPTIDAINETWFFPCRLVPSVDPGRNPTASATNESVLESSGSCYPVSTPSDKNICVAPASKQPQCFRGIHDNSLTDQEIRETIQLGSALISRGGDHFDIHFDVPLLVERLPSIVAKLRQVLTETYKLPGQLHPVAFRVNAAAPMDADRVPLYFGYQQSVPHPLNRLLNFTRYIRWVQESIQHNEHIAQSYYSLPWPFRASLSSTRRDVCHLMADLQADPRFGVLTSIFLSNGAGRDFRGGAALFVDDTHLGDSSPRPLLFSRTKLPRKIRRGLAVDGARGRLIVSTGGLENVRCRLPTRSGIRATLQIWWGC